MKDRIIESFLLRIKENEEYVFKNSLDDFIFPIIPFYQLIYLTNIELILKELINLEYQLNCRLIRLDGYLTIAVDEQHSQEDKIKDSTIRILKIMRF